MLPLAIDEYCRFSNYNEYYQSGYEKSKITKGVVCGGGVGVISVNSESPFYSYNVCSNFIAPD